MNRNKRSNRGNNQGQAKKLASQQESSLVLLRQIECTLRNQNTKPEPGVKDAQWLAPPRNKVYSFVRTASLGPISSVTSGETDLAFAPSLSTFPGAADFTGLFDSYRIRMFRFIFTPQALPISTTSSSTAFGNIITIADYDDANADTYSDLEQYAEAQVATGGNYIERVIVPHPAQAMYSGSVFTSFGRTSNSQWLNTASSTIPYYGLKFAMALSTLAVPVYILTVQARIEFQNSR